MLLGVAGTSASNWQVQCVQNYIDMTPMPNSAEEDVSSQKSLPPSLAKRIFDGLRHLVPVWLEEPFREKERGVILLERQIQRKFINEYRSQVKTVEPVLRARGRMIGEAIKQSFISRQSASGSTVQYEDCEQGTASLSFFQSPATREIMDAMDPLISPVLKPFVDGIQEPIRSSIDQIKFDIVKAFAVTAGASLVTGFVLGRLSSSVGRKNEK